MVKRRYLDVVGVLAKLHVSKCFEFSQLAVHELFDNRDDLVFELLNLQAAFVSFGLELFNLFRVLAARGHETILLGE